METLVGSITCHMTPVLATCDVLATAVSFDSKVHSMESQCCGF